VLAELRHLSRVKVGEVSSVALPLTKDSEPRESSLGALKDEKFKYFPVVPHGPAPLSVVIAEHKRVTLSPQTNPHIKSEAKVIFLTWRLDPC